MKKVFIALSVLLCGCAAVKGHDQCADGLSCQKNTRAGEASESLHKRRLVSMPSFENLWVCEVEASSKIFTGVGSSRDEAFRSARDTCAFHFQTSYCTRAECKPAQ
jgi:hypothetical protein